MNEYNLDRRMFLINGFIFSNKVNIIWKFSFFFGQNLEMNFNEIRSLKIWFIKC